MRRAPDYAGLAELAIDQDHVATRAQLSKLGFSDERIATMIGHRHWVQLQRGVYLLSPGPATWRQVARAAQLAGGDVVALDAGSALTWWGVDGPEDDRVELVVAGPAGGPAPRGVVIHHPSRPISVRVRDGVRVVAIEDALLGFAASSRNRRQVEVAVESALLSRRTTERKIWQTIGRNSRRGVRGVALLRFVMDHRPNGKPSRSVLELELVDLIRASDLPLPQRNVEVVDGNGERREIDLCYLAQKGAIEADSRRWHSTASQQASDRRRQAALEAVGFAFVRVTWTDIFERPEWVIDQIRELLLRVVAA
ncbi:MAG TPA: DUF559 domain-containing protein [Acidimicrobiales bacterium]|nr:DUF559 domain-containing protein [Acidimicrobiales bacterium]